MAMIFGLLFRNFETEGGQLLYARIKSQDGSVVRARLANVRLTFETAFGETRLPLSRIRRLDNVAHLTTLRNVTRLHRFHIFCADGNELFGVPLSPDRLPVAVAGTARTWNFVRLIEILSLEILSPGSFAITEHALN